MSDARNPCIRRCDESTSGSALFLQTRFYPLAVFSIDFNAGKGNLDNMKGMAEEHFGQSESIEVEKSAPKVRKKKKKDGEGQ
jgi:uncharacterized protein (DUF2141 family)